MTLKRLALTAAAAITVSPLLPASAAHADGSYTCLGAERIQDTDGHYTLTAPVCDGVGHVDVDVTVTAGPAKGTYHCGSAFSWNGFLTANRCSIVGSRRVRLA